MIDTHAHYYFDAFDADLPAVVAADTAAGVRHAVQIGCDETSSLAAIRLAQQHESLHATVGLHPMDVDFVGKAPREYQITADYAAKAGNHEQLWEVFDAMIAANREHIVGIGETGFDRHYVDTPELIQLQQNCFLAHLHLCEKHDLPVIIHSRDATPQLRKFLQTHMPKGKYRGVVHCWSEDGAFAQEIVHDHGLMIGVGGVATYGAAGGIRDAISSVPIEALLTETDAPYLVPNGYRKRGKKRCQSAMMDEIVQLISELKNMPVNECAAQLYANGCAFYGLEV